MLLFQKVARVLTDTWATRDVDFRFRTLSVTPMRLNLVGDAIARKKIAVYKKEPDSGDSRTAYYLEDDLDGEKGNAFYVSDFDLSDVWYSALIVHEAVHAANDIYSVSGMKHKVEEAAAYIAQALYLHANSVKPADVEKLLDPGQPNYWAFQIAKTFRAAAPKGAQVETYFPAPGQADPIQLLLAKVKMKYGSVASVYIGYDGVPGVNAPADEDLDMTEFAMRRSFSF